MTIKDLRCAKAVYKINIKEVYVERVKLVLLNKPTDTVVGSMIHSLLGDRMHIFLDKRTADTIVRNSIFGYPEDFSWD